MTLGLLSEALQAVGIVVAGIGLAKTWAEVPGERFFGGFTERIARLWRSGSSAARRLVRRILRRRPDPVTGTAGAATGQLQAFDARVRVQFRVLPVDLDAPTAVAELDDRTRRLMTLASDISERTADEDTAIRKELAAEAEQLREGLHRLEGRQRRLVVDGVRWEASGLFLVGLGTVVGFFA